MSDNLSTALSRLDEILANVVTAKVMSRLGFQVPSAPAMSLATLRHNANDIAAAVFDDPETDKSVERIASYLESLR